MTPDADALGPHEERWLLATLAERPWRDALAAAFAQSRPELYARLTDPGQAAVLSLLEVAAGARCLDATGGWGQIAVPLARRARVVVLAPSTPRAAIVRRIAAQEGVALDVMVGALGSGAFAAAAFDALLLHDPPGLDDAPGSDAATACAVLCDVARLLRPGGRAYVGVANDLAPLAGSSTGQSGPDASGTLGRYVERLARAGLTPTAAYACFPDHARPRFFVPLALVDDFVRETLGSAGSGTGLTPLYAALANEGIARHFAPSFAFILQVAGVADRAHGGGGAAPGTEPEVAA